MVNGPNQISKEANAPYRFSSKERERVPHSTLHTPTVLHSYSILLACSHTPTHKSKTRQKKKKTKKENSKNPITFKLSLKSVAWTQRPLVFFLFHFTVNTQKWLPTPSRRSQSLNLVTDSLPILLLLLLLSLFHGVSTLITIWSAL